MLRLRRVAAKLAGNEASNASFGGRIDDPRLVGKPTDADNREDNILALENLQQGLRAVICSDNFGRRWEGRFGVLPRHRCDAKIGGDERVEDCRPEVAAALQVELAIVPLIVYSCYVKHEHDGSRHTPRTAMFLNLSDMFLIPVPGFLWVSQGFCVFEYGVI